MILKEHTISTKDEYITSGFGMRPNPTGAGTEMHAGIDIVSSKRLEKTQDVGVIAIADGVVVEYINGALVGYTIAISHECKILSRYQHMKAGSVIVKVGDKVKKGQIIGIVGNTGRSTAPHLHFGLKENSTFYNNGEWVDPMPYLMGIKMIGINSTPDITETAVNYFVQAQANLNIRKGAGTNFTVADTIRDNGVYTIVAESDGIGAKKWGKLQNGKGWISLDYTSRVNQPDIPVNTTSIKVSSRVRVKQGAKTYTGGNISAYVYTNTYTVDTLNGDRAVLDSRGICTPFNVKDLILA